MTAADFFAQHLAVLPVVAIFRGKSPAETARLCEAAWQAGVDLVEVPVQNEAAWEAFDAAVALGAANGKPVGAGTVLTVEQLEQVQARGGRFAVAPGFHADVATRANELGLPLLPGVATASEVAAALRLGYTALKAFPARELGLTWAKAIKGPFPQVSLVATGGVSAANAADFLRGGYDAVAVGSAFESPSAVAALTAAVAAWRSA
ncbi:MAG: bifunctional 4-hydroxy-2-oxoglutarate aldolase/2-dehydro-3-deoxy-phosphogluconate aldolase [Bifidobacteriaceae bacterium]|jgi:2-dehydro-3-deoxyphosphogluconate aldolase/(4S)-4-hydroxy-2-oxoglutarate aldolase|nr:bifunctional 4-hydroxy-2-oxoglutarate aldolase/2-dehydro-3-deoxy-phosphogluconate aldolase [Bifidobacteriaceae bacterium]